MTRAASWIAQRSGQVADAIFVPVCAWCGRRGDWICANCLPTVQPITSPGCGRCGVPVHAPCECSLLPAEVNSLRSVFPFEGWVRAAIHKLKYDGERARSRTLAETVELISPNLPGADGIVPVPIHPRRLQSRGFNQAELLAGVVSEVLAIPLLRPLARVADSGSQVGRAGPDRWLAVDGAFACIDTLAVRNMRLIVFDDVITTGATVSSCARTLVDAGAAEVRGLSIARG